MRHLRRRSRKQTPYSGRATRSPPLARRVPLNELSSRRKTEATFAELGCERGSRRGREYNHPHLLPRPTRRRFLCSQMQIAAGLVCIFL